MNTIISQISWNTDVKLLACWKNYRLILWFLLGLILPYIGFLLCWILYDSDRDKAKSIMLGAIVSTVVTTFLPYILSFFNGDNSDSGNDGSDNAPGQQVKVLLDIYKSL